MNIDRSQAEIAFTLLLSANGLINEAARAIRAGAAPKAARDEMILSLGQAMSSHFDVLAKIEAIYPDLSLTGVPSDEGLLNFERSWRLKRPFWKDGEG